MVSFGFGLNKRLAINCVLIFVSHFEMGSQPFFSGQALQMSDELLLIAKVFEPLSPSWTWKQESAEDGRVTLKSTRRNVMHVQ